MFIIVRPQQSLAKSVKFFQEHGFSCCGLAVQSIEYAGESIQALMASIAQLQVNNSGAAQPLFDSVIVTSGYAAEILITELEKASVGLSQFGKRIIAVGSSTAKRLQESLPTRRVLVPSKHDSEGIVSLPQLNDIAEQRIALIKGAGGRDVISSTLSQRGAAIFEYSVYQRRRIEFDLTKLRQSADQISMVIVTSGEAATILLENPDAAFLKNKRWLVISERVAKLVEQHGVASIDISAGASDAALIKCVQQMME